ncbi:MAG: hypothetical protein HYV97_18690 [Bdellovibrio sp.]|nr:hypothetical protein [Bdellovibrio sp.]
MSTDLSQHIARLNFGNDLFFHQIPFAEDVMSRAMAAAGINSTATFQSWCELASDWKGPGAKQLFKFVNGYSTIHGVRRKLEELKKKKYANDEVSIQNSFYEHNEQQLKLKDFQNTLTKILVFGLNFPTMHAGRVICLDPEGESIGFGKYGVDWEVRDDDDAPYGVDANVWAGIGLQVEGHWQKKRKERFSLISPFVHEGKLQVAMLEDEPFDGDCSIYFDDFVPKGTWQVFDIDGCLLASDVAFARIRRFHPQLESKQVTRKQDFFEEKLAGRRIEDVIRWVCDLSPAERGVLSGILESIRKE